MADENKIIISRMQQRRGNRVDLPQPLRPGEIGLASDSKEVFIGLDPAIGVTKQNANGVNINNIVGGYSYANGYLNNNILRIILPSKRLTGLSSNSSVYTPASSSNHLVSYLLPRLPDSRLLSLSHSTLFFPTLYYTSPR